MSKSSRFQNPYRVSRVPMEVERVHFVMVVTRARQTETANHLNTSRTVSHTEERCHPVPHRNRARITRPLRAHVRTHARTHTRNSVPRCAYRGPHSRAVNTQSRPVHVVTRHSSPAARRRALISVPSTISDNTAVVTQSSLPVQRETINGTPIVMPSGLSSS